MSDDDTGWYAPRDAALLDEEPTYENRAVTVTRDTFSVSLPKTGRYYPLRLENSEVRLGFEVPQRNGDRMNDSDFQGMQARAWENLVNFLDELTNSLYARELAEKFGLEVTRTHKGHD